MAPDYYALTREIADDLRTEGFVEEARQLVDVIAAGFSATEILMGIRWRLSQMDCAGRTGADTRRKIESLLEALDRVLE